MSRHFEKAEGLFEHPDEVTHEYLFNQTMLRIKDPKPSLDFYTRVLGEMKFSLYFLGYLSEEEAGDVPGNDAKRLTFTFGREAMLELTHNWGTEDEPEFSYHDGNAEPQGFGHIGITVPDVYAAAERFEKLGVSFIKRPDDGKMKGLAFIKDPDGYWIEILQANMMEKQQS